MDSGLAQSVISAAAVPHEPRSGGLCRAYGRRLSRVSDTMGRKIGFL